MSDITPALRSIIAAELLADAQNEASRDRLWAHLKRICDLGNAYIAACMAADTRPNWRVALFPGEDSPQ